MARNSQVNYEGDINISTESIDIDKNKNMKKLKRYIQNIILMSGGLIKEHAETGDDTYYITYKKDTRNLKQPVSSFARPLEQTKNGFCFLGGAFIIEDPEFKLTELLYNCTAFDLTHNVINLRLTHDQYMNGKFDKFIAEVENKKKKIEETVIKCSSSKSLNSSTTGMKNSNDSSIKDCDKKITKNKISVNNGVLSFEFVNIEEIKRQGIEIKNNQQTHLNNLTADSINHPRWKKKFEEYKKNTENADDPKSKLYELNEIHTLNTGYEIVYKCACSAKFRIYGNIKWYMMAGKYGKNHVYLKLEGSPTVSKAHLLGALHRYGPKGKAEDCVSNRREDCYIDNNCSYDKEPSKNFRNYKTITLSSGVKETQIGGKNAEPTSNETVEVEENYIRYGDEYYVPAKVNKFLLNNEDNAFLNMDNYWYKNNSNDNITLSFLTKHDIESHKRESAKIVETEEAAWAKVAANMAANMAANVDKCIEECLPTEPDCVTNCKEGMEMSPVEEVEPTGGGKPIKPKKSKKIKKMRKNKTQKKKKNKNKKTHTIKYKLIRKRTLRKTRNNTSGVFDAAKINPASIILPPRKH